MQSRLDHETYLPSVPRMRTDFRQRRVWGWPRALYEESVMVAVDCFLCRDFSHFITATSEFDLLTD